MEETTKAAVANGAKYIGVGLAMGKTWLGALVAALVGVVAACGSGSEASTTAESAAPQPATTAVAAEPRLSLKTSLCDDWRNASAREQRRFSAQTKSSDRSVDEMIDLYNRACPRVNRAKGIADAVAVVLINELTPPPDKNAETRIAGSLAAEISRAIKTSWNRCNASDVCVTGELSLAVGCEQPDLQVRKLRCFVTTKRGAAGGGDLGYTVAADVGKTSYSWRLARGD
jgi:hypothetical protein